MCHDRTVGCVAAAALRAAATLAGIDCCYVPAWVHPRTYRNTYSIYARMYCIYRGCVFYFYILAYRNLYIYTNTNYDIYI